MKTREVSLADILDARERRAARQRELLAEYQSSLISFTMNIPGAVKNSDLILKGYLEGLRLLRMQLEYAGVPVLHREERRDFTGNEAFLVVDAPAPEVKRLTCAIEEADPLGRLFDLDVLGPDGAKLDRSEVGLGPRSCLICGGPAAVCASRRVHTARELQSRAREILCGHFQQKFADRMAELATRSLLYEVSVTPKPGLVDRANSGSHPDMDFYTFLRSASSLTPWFRDMALRGARAANEPPSAAFQALNYLGRQAERAMLRASGGANAHKGAVFSIGLLCGAAGRLYARGAPLRADDLLRECAALAKNSERGASPKTAGDRFFQTHGVGGVRGEAASGFPLVRELGLPLLRALLDEGCCPDEAGGIVLLHLMAGAEDTCLISRAGHERWSALRERLRRELAANPRPGARERELLDREFIQNNWSAGGSADLLAICWLLLFTEEETEAANGTIQ